MTAGELAEHAGYLDDSVKLAGYTRALQALVPDRSVLDLGTGSGILGLIAARAGARRVYAVDDGPILGAALEAARRSNLDDRIVHIRGRSTEITVPQVDVAVCDQIGGFVHDAGILEYFADVRRRLLAPGGRLVPAGFRMLVAPAECTKVRDQITLWGTSPGGFDFSGFGELAVNSEHHVSAEEVRVLAPAVEIARIDSDHVEPIVGGGSTTIEEDGRFDCIVGWFEADLGAGVTLTNDPASTGRMQRWCNVYALTEGVPVARGATGTLEVDVRPLLGAVTWRVQVADASGKPLASEHHSTLLGRFLAEENLARTAGSPVAATRLGVAVSRMLGLADGTHSTGEIVAQLRAEGLLDFDAPSVEQTLRSTLERFSTTETEAAASPRLTDVSTG